MAAKKTNYRIQTIVGFEAPNRPIVIGTINGKKGKPDQPDILRVPARKAGPEGITVALTDEQAELVKKDAYLILHEVDADGNVTGTPDQNTGGKMGTPVRPINQTSVPEPTGYKEVGGSGERKSKRAAKADLPNGSLEEAQTAGEAAQDTAETEPTETTSTDTTEASSDSTEA